MEDLFSTPAPASVPSSEAEYIGVMSGLSDPQRRAVTHEGGPLIVLAGPGTGKTRVITARVAHMINEREIAPDRIAAVTFTNKAAGELRDRLGRLVGDTIAARVQASTFHSLGYGIVRRFGDLLGLPSGITIIDSAQRNRLIKEIIRDERLYRDSLGSGISAAMEHAHKAMESLRYLGMDSDAGMAWLAGARDEASGLEAEERGAREGELDRFNDALGVYRRFEVRCRDKGWVMIDDLIMLPTKLVREHAAVASILRHEMKHFVVDEFQDVNRGQIEMIRALCPPRGDADVCVVGDDDQSIYGFRGSDDRAFAHFESIWPGCTTVPLTTNYRSARVIVDASNATITRAQSRFAPDKEANAYRGDVAGSSLELVRLEDDAQTGEVVASMLLKMASEGGESFSFSSCAVIGRSNPFLEQIAQTLLLEGIPVDMRERVSPMEDEGAKDVLAWARLLVDPESSNDLRRVLVRPPYRVDAMRLGSLLSGYRAARSRFEQCEDGSIPDPGALIAWVIARSDEHTRVKAEAMHALAQELAQVSSERPAADAITEIIKRTGVVHRELGDSRSRSRRIQAISALVRFARSRADRFDAPGDLGAMLAYFDDLDEKEQSLGELPEEKVNGDSGVSEASGADRGAVSLISAHSAKGLEFDTVFVVRVGQHGFAPSGKGDDAPLPEGVGDDTGDDRDARERVADEERRVFFVALTRGERRVILTAKVPKKPTAANYALELRESLGERLIEHDVRDVIDPERMGDAVSRLSAEFKAIRSVRDAFDQAKREARRDAAMSIDAHELGEIGHEEMMARLNAAAERAAATSEILRTGAIPGWVEDAATRAFAAKLVEVLDRVEVVDDQGALHPGLTPPLTLSFSQISSYLHCPRCYLAEYIYKLSQDDKVHAVMGTAVHKGLELFYGRWRDADADGEPTPGFDALRNLVRDQFLSDWPHDRELDAERLEQLDAMLDVFWRQMHREDAHIEEIEKSIVLPYECDGVTHRLKAKIDRVDAGAGGGRRVIDYKTGSPRIKLTEPKKDDLQLGIYAMALTHELGDPGPGSVCEYWCLQDGSRGVIGFDALDMKKIRGQIDKAIRGMVSGDWSRGSRCSEDDASCTIFDSPGFEPGRVFSDMDLGDSGGK